MNTFISHSIPFRDVLRDLANEMNTSYSQSCEEYALSIPECYGEGQIKGINFGEGIGLLMYDCVFYEDTEIHFIVNQVHPLKFMFCEVGSFSHRFQDSSENKTVEELQNVIVASDNHKGHIIHFKAGERSKINNLEIDRKKFYESQPCEISRLKESLKNLFTDTSGKKMFFYHGDYSLQTAEAFSKINNFKGSPFLKNLFVHAQCYHIFFIQVLEYEDSKNNRENQSLLRRSELYLIKNAAEFIDSDLLNYISVKNLAVKIGLNPNKLQSGFQQVYGKTVNGYVQEKRLGEAAVLIKNTDLTFSEIADRVGIKSKSYFSKIFKDKYGLTPSQIRKQRKTN